VYLLAYIVTGPEGMRGGSTQTGVKHGEGDRGGINWVGNRALAPVSDRYSFKNRRRILVKGEIFGPVPGECHAVVAVGTFEKTSMFLLPTFPFRRK